MYLMSHSYVSTMEKYCKGVCMQYSITRLSSRAVNRDTAHTIHIHMIVSLIDTITIGLRTTEESCPSDSSQLL